MSDLPSDFRALDDQPPEVEWTTVDRVFIKQMLIAKAGSFVPQHAHKYDHTSMLATGAVRVWRDGVFDGDRQAPEPIFIAAGVKHTFQALEDNTLIFCIHNAMRPDVAAVLEEHQLVDEI